MTKRAACGAAVGKHGLPCFRLRPRAQKARLIARSAVAHAAAVAVLALAGCSGGGTEADAETIGLARRAYTKAVAAGVDLGSGPCLGVIKEDWVADVVHVPRTSVDDDPANQCEAYREGDAHHFVELDVDGNYVRSR